MEQFNNINKYNYPYEPENDDDNKSRITKSNIEEVNSNESFCIDKSNLFSQDNQFISKDECSQEEDKNISYIINKKENNFNLLANLGINDESFSKNRIEQNNQIHKKDSTGDTSKLGKKTIKLFNISKKQNRLNNILNSYKVQINQYNLEKLNKLLKNSGVEELKVIKMRKINSRLCTANTSKEDNLNMLKLKNKEIFYYNKINHETQKPKNYFSFKSQELNKDYIQIILNIIKEKKMLGQYTLKLLEIENFLEMTYEDVIKEFYNSQKFRDFISKKETIEMNKFIEELKGIKLEEKYGVINLINSILDIKRSPKDKNQKKKIE